MSRCVETFQQYYDTKTSSRKLRWLHNLGQVTLSSFFKQKKYELSVNTIQVRSNFPLFIFRYNIFLQEHSQIRNKSNFISPPGCHSAAVQRLQGNNYRQLVQILRDSPWKPQAATQSLRVRPLPSGLRLLPFFFFSDSYSLYMRLIYFRSFLRRNQKRNMLLTILLLWIRSLATSRCALCKSIMSVSLSVCQEAFLSRYWC